MPQINYCKIWLHVILSTSNRLPLILENETSIIKILTECFENQNCKVEAIAGLKEHVHVMLLCNANKAFSEIVKNVYNESQQLINEKFFKASSFAWHEDIVIFSVSESQIPKLKDYIAQQKEFHKEKTFVKELDDFLIIHGLKK